MNAPREIKIAQGQKADVPVVFADSVRTAAAIDGILRIELCAGRPEAPDPQHQTITVYPQAWLALTVSAAAALQAALAYHLGELEKQGALKRAETPLTPTTPKH